jgi:ferrochelatase
MEARLVVSAVGVLLVNLGTPRSPEVSDVRRYLAEFLSDPRVLDMNAVGRWLLLHGIILRTRPRKTAAAYRQVWTAAGSPLLVESVGLRDGVAAELGDGYRVALAMRYGEPAVEPALRALLADAPDRLVVVPLYPQYATAATGSSLARVFEALDEIGQDGPRPEVRTVPAFYDDPDWLESWAAVAGDDLAAFAPDHVLFSYHGLPERQIRRLDATGRHCFASPECCDTVGPENRACYRAQCFATTRGLVASLGLEATPITTSFQSRLSSGWIQPYTDEVLPQLAAAGVKRLALLCPAFVADCLETLEEIDIRLREQWHELGGEALFRVPCPNDHPRFARAVATWVRRCAEAEGSRESS